MHRDIEPKGLGSLLEICPDRLPAHWYWQLENADRQVTDLPYPKHIHRLNWQLCIKDMHNYW